MGDGAALTMRDSRVEMNAGHGIELRSGTLNPTLERVTLADNQGAAVWQAADVIIPTYHGLTATGNLTDAIVIQAGALAHGAQWDFAPAGTPVLLQGFISLPGGMLTLAPGTELRFLPGAALSIEAGTFYALGTPDAPITLTAATPQAGLWGGLSLLYGSRAILDYCDLSYGGGGLYPLLKLDTSDAVIQNCRIHHSASEGILVGSMSPTITPTLVANHIYSNAFGLRNVDTVTLTASHNWWGDASGPYHPSLNPLGRGDAVSDYVAFSPWLTQAATTTALSLSRIEVQVNGPGSVSPGEVAQYAISYHNFTTRTIGGPLILSLPSNAVYLDSTGGGGYWAQRHEVLWLDADLTPGASGAFAVRVRYMWGLTEDSVDRAIGYPASILPAIQADHADFQAVATTETPLTEAQVNAQRVVSPELDALYGQALQEGLYFGSATLQELSTGALVTQVVLLNQAQHKVLFLSYQAGGVMGLQIDPNGYTLRDAGGSAVYDPQMQQWTYAGTWLSTTMMVRSALAPCGLLNHGKCVVNCAAPSLASLILSLAKVKAISVALDAVSCVQCAQGDSASCISCAAALRGIPGVGEALDTWAIMNCMEDCRHDQSKYGCEGDRIFCDRVGYPSNGHLWRCDKWSGELTPGSTMYCGLYDESSRGRHWICLQDIGCYDVANGVDGSYYFTYDLTHVRIPRDPNAKYGPPGDVLGGERLTYTLEYENEGAGRAYGVYVVDPLDAAFDKNTLRFAGTPATYFSATRTLIWSIGELAPQGQPGATGAVTFSARLRDDLPGGTVIVNRAEVHFPSVLETTPTNAVVNVVQPIAALPQTVQTGAQQAVSITLQGRDVGGGPLAYTVTQSPLYGYLTGLAPHLTYQPMADFVGVDGLSFQVSNAITASRPADVRIVVAPSAADTHAPTLEWTVPVSGAQATYTSYLPISQDAKGPIYPPAVAIRFSEPLSATIISTRTVQLRDSRGQPLSATVRYDALARQARLTLRAALPGSGTYTGWVSSAVSDASGNPLGADYTWHFQINLGAYHIYLPLVLKY